MTSHRDIIHDSDISPLRDTSNSEEDLIKVPCRITEWWTEHFNTLLNRQASISEVAIAEIPKSSVTEELKAVPTTEETTRAIKQMSSGTASGEDNIPTEIYKHGGDSLVQELIRLFSVIWDAKPVPQDFKDGLMVHFFKKGDKDTVITTEASQCSPLPARL